MTKALTNWRMMPGEGNRWQWRIEWKRADQWVGRFITESDQWYCFIPCLPVHFNRMPAWPKDGLPDTPEFNQLIDQAPGAVLWSSKCEDSTQWIICDANTGAIKQTFLSEQPAKLAIHRLKTPVLSKFMEEQLSFGDIGEAKDYFRLDNSFLVEDPSTNGDDN